MTGGEEGARLDLRTSLDLGQAYDVVTGGCFHAVMALSFIGQWVYSALRPYHNQHPSRRSGALRSPVTTAQ